MDEDLIIKLEMKHDWFSRLSYDSFRLEQPSVNVEGLAYKEDEYFIVCPDLSDTIMTDDGKSIHEWFESNRVISSPITLVKEKPEGSVWLDNRTFQENIELKGRPWNRRDLQTELDLFLPKSFPSFRLGHNREAGEILIKVSRRLSEDEVLILKGYFEKFSDGVEQIRVSVDSSVDNTSSFDRVPNIGDIGLVPSRRLVGASQKLKSIVEFDEQFWLDNRVKLFAGSQEIEVDEGLSHKWVQPQSRCLINTSVFPALDIRNYLSLYEKVTLVAPLAERESDILNSLGIKLDELIELVKMDRVQMLLPHSIDRYSFGLLEPIVESVPENLLLSRHLATLTVLDTRRRMPFLYPPFGISERREVLRAMSQASRSSSSDLDNFLGHLAKALSEIWNGLEAIIHHQGAAGTNFSGIGRVIGITHNAMTKQDVSLELLLSSSTVEWAGAIKASAFPIELDGYSDAGYVEVLASLYTGINHKSVPNYQKNLKIIIDEVLSIRQEIPVTEFARDFNGSDIDRFRRFVNSIAQQSYNQEELQSVLDAFNQSVRQYEKREQFLNTWKIGGLVSLPLTIGFDVKETIIVSLGTWFASVCFPYLLKNKDTRPVIEPLVDSLNGLIAGVNPNAVLVNRLRKR